MRLIPSAIPLLTPWGCAAAGVLTGYLPTLPRLPYELSSASTLGLGLALLLRFLPAQLAESPVSKNGLAFMLGGATGLALAQRWLVPALRIYGHFSTVGAVVLILGAAVALASCWLLGGYLLGVLCRRLPFGLGALLGALLLAGWEHAMQRLAPFLEPVTLGFTIADLPWAKNLVCAAGSELLCGAGVLAALGAWEVLRSREHARWQALAVLCGVLIATTTAALVHPARPVTDRLRIAGIQLGRSFDGVDWRQQQLAAFLAAEPREPGLVTIGPESVNPLMERERNLASLLYLPLAPAQARIFGMIVRRSHELLNSVLVQDSAAPLVQLRSKRRLVPLVETWRLAVPQEPEPQIRLRGLPVLLPICYEILDRASLRVQRAALGITISADGFDASGAASKIMTRATWLRAMELGIPFVRVSDMSASAAFLPDGRALGQLGTGPGVLRAELPLTAP